MPRQNGQRSGNRRGRGAAIAGGLDMIWRGFGVLLALWTVACSPLPPPAPSAPPAPVPAPVVLSPEPCAPDGSYARLPDEVDVYDEPETDDPYAEESPYDPDDPK